MKKSYVLFTLSFSALCCAMDTKKNESENNEAMLEIEAKIHKRFASIIACEDNQQRFGRGASDKTQGADLQHGGKYVAVQNRIVMLPQRQFGRGSSGKNESQEIRAKL